MASPQFLQLLAEQREAFCQGFSAGFVELARLQCRELALESAAGRRRQAETSATAEQAGVGGAGVEASAIDNVKATIQHEAECDANDDATRVEHNGTDHAVREQASCGGWPQADADSAAGGLGGGAAESASWQLVSGRWLRESWAHVRDHLDVEARDAIDNPKVLSNGPGAAVKRAETIEAEGEAAVRTAAGVRVPGLPADARAAGVDQPPPGVLCSGSFESLESLEMTISLGKGVDDLDGHSDHGDFGPTATGPSSERSGCDDSGVKQLGWAIQAEEPLPGQPGQATRKANTLVVPVTRGQRHTSEKGNMQSIQKESTCAMDYNSQRESILDVKLAATAVGGETGCTLASCGLATEESTYEDYNIQHESNRDEALTPIGGAREEVGDSCGGGGGHIQQKSTFQRDYNIQKESTVEDFCIQSESNRDEALTATGAAREEAGGTCGGGGGGHTQQESTSQWDYNIQKESTSEDYNIQQESTNGGGGGLANGAEAPVGETTAEGTLLALARRRGPVEEAQAWRLIQTQRELGRGPIGAADAAWCNEVQRHVHAWFELKGQLESQDYDARAGRRPRRARGGTSKQAVQQ